MTYAAVFPLVRTRAFSEPFDYLVPRELTARAVPGALAAVPLGAQTVIGVVLALSDSTSHEGRVLPLRDVLHVPPIPEELLELARTIERYYLTSFADALALVCPPAGALKIVRQYELTDAGQGGRRRRRGPAPRAAGLRLRSGRLTPAAERYRRKGWLRVSYRVHVVGVTPPARLLRRGDEAPARLGARQRAALDLLQEAGTLEERELRAASGLSAQGLGRLLETGAVVVVDAAGDQAAHGGADGAGEHSLAGRRRPRWPRPPWRRRRASGPAPRCRTSPTCSASSSAPCTASCARPGPATRSCCTA